MAQDFDHENEDRKVSGTFGVPANTINLAAPQQGEQSIVVRVRAEDNKPVIDIDSTFSMGDTHEQLLDVIRILENPKGSE